MWAATCTFPGCGPKWAGIELRAQGRDDRVTGSARRPASRRVKRSPDSTLKTVPSVEEDDRAVVQVGERGRGVERRGADREAVGGSGSAGSRKPGGSGREQQVARRLASAGSAGSPYDSRSASSGGATTPARMNPPAALTSTVAYGSPSRSAAVIAPKSTSSHTSASGRHSAQGQDALRPRRRDPVRESLAQGGCSRAATGSSSGAISAAVSTGTAASGNTAKPRAASSATTDGRPANATAWPARARRARAARAARRGRCHPRT